MSPAVPPPILEVYYSPSCAPCRLELPAVAEFAREDGSHVRIVIVDQQARAREELQAASPQLAATAIAAKKENPRALLLAAGDSDGILPYARVIAPDGNICAKWRGPLTLERAKMLIASCITSPNRHRS